MMLHNLKKFKIQKSQVLIFKLTGGWGWWFAFDVLTLKD